MSEVVFRYGDDYPEQCPPEAAYPPKDISLYRICKSEALSSVLIPDDFIPVWENKKRKFPKNKEECAAKALSFNNDKDTLSSLMQNHPNIGSRIVKINLNESCGLIIKTHKGHYSLWDLIEPGIIKSVGNEWEEVV